MPICMARSIVWQRPCPSLASQRTEIAVAEGAVVKKDGLMLRKGGMCTVVRVHLLVRIIVYAWNIMTAYKSGQTVERLKLQKNFILLCQRNLSSCLVVDSKEPEL